nr:undecaprenyl-diphosphate phosphatase [Spirulina subsalsa]
MNKLQRKGLVVLSEMALGLSLAIAFSTLTHHIVLAQTPSPATGMPQINWFQALVLGMVQGLTEFIPISSTAHLKAIPVFLGWGDPGVTFTAVVQLGSIGAVLWYFRQDLIELTWGAITQLRILAAKKELPPPTPTPPTPEGPHPPSPALSLKIAIGIAVGTLPIVIVGLGFKLFIPDLDNSPLRSMNTIAIASIVMASLLGLAEKLGQRRRDFDHLTTQDGILMGIAQALAIIPGVSRSGSTITAALFIGLERATAARFSFLLGIPAITLAGLVELKTEVLDANVGTQQWIPLGLGVLSSAVFSYLAIAWLMNYLQKQNTWLFVWYRLAFGIVILIASAFGLFANV